MFLKKMNIKRDKLYRKFSPNIVGGYYYIKIENGKERVIEYDELDKKSQKQLLEERRTLLKDKNILNKEINQYNEQERYIFLKNIGYLCDSFEYLGPVEGTISNKLYEFLLPFLSDNNSILGIHRIGNNFSNKQINDIFNYGLTITGHISEGINTKKSINQNISYYPSNYTVLKELMYADLYKGSVGSILIQIPDEALIKNTDVLLEKEGNVILNPKYIIGYIPVYENHHIENIINNPNFNKSESYHK